MTRKSESSTKRATVHRSGKPPPIGRPSLSLGAYYFCFFGALGVHLPFFPLWLEAHGFTGLRMSAIAALLPVLGMLGPPLMGWLADTSGKRGQLVRRLGAVAALSTVGLSLAELFHWASVFGVVFLGTLGFAACRSPLIQLADRITLESVANYGRIRVWGSIGFLLTALLFGHAVPEGAWHWTPVAIAGLLGCAFIVSLRFPAGTSLERRQQVAAKVFWRSPRYLTFLGCAALALAAHNSYDLCASLHFRDLGANGDWLGNLWALGVVAEVLLLAAASSWTQRVKPEALLALGYGAGALRWLLMSQLTDVRWALAIQCLHALSFGLTWIASLEFVRQCAAPSSFGAAQGVYMGVQSAGGALGMFVWGPVYERAGGASVFSLASGVAALAALVMLFLAFTARSETTEEAGLSGTRV